MPRNEQKDPAVIADERAARRKHLKELFEAKGHTELDDALVEKILCKVGLDYVTIQDACWSEGVDPQNMRSYKEKTAHWERWKKIAKGQRAVNATANLVAAQGNDQIKKWQSVLMTASPVWREALNKSSAPAGPAMIVQLIGGGTPQAPLLPPIDVSHELSAGGLSSGEDG